MEQDFLSYEYLDHTSDVLFVARGRTMAEAFANAAYATIDIVSDHTRVSPAVKGAASIEAEDEKALLYDFLEYFIVLVDSEGFLLSKIERMDLFEDYRSGTFRLNFEYSGDRDLSAYEVKRAVKAVTYQQMEFYHEAGIFAVSVVVDI